MNNVTRKILIISILIALTLCTLLSVSYAFYVVNPNKNYETIASTNVPACLNISITDEKPLSLEGDYALPIKDNRLLNSSEEVLANYKYSFSVTNGCAEDIEISSSLIPFKTSTIPMSMLKYVLVKKGDTLPNEGNYFTNVKKLSSNAMQEIKQDKGFDVTHAYELTKTTYQAGQTIDYDLYLWIDYEEGGTNNATMDKQFQGFIMITNYSSNFEYDSVAFNSEGLVASDIAYSDSKETLLNPERGYYTHYAIEIPETIDDTTKNSMLSSIAIVQNEMALNQDTLSLTVFYLTNYTNKDLNEDVLDYLNTYCNSFREKGYKLIVRFAYIGDDSTKDDPEDFNRILSHIAYLKPFFNNNKDVIHAVQLGFIGPWGEWHSSKYAEENYRVQVIKKMLETLPKDMPILLRRPLYYKEYFGSSAFDEKAGFTYLDKARVGIFNDGFLSTGNDYGTYETFDRESELNWMSALTKYTLFGGETIYYEEDPSYSAPSSAVNDFTKTHINFLNRVYHPTIISSWKNENITSSIDSNYVGTSAYDYFKNKLGYRYVLTEALVPNYEVKQGEYLHLSFKINNIGYGNLTKYRNAELIIEKDKKYYVNSTSIDMRKWFSGETVTEELVFKLPSNIEEGQWNIYLRFPDASSSLLNHTNYYIKLANPNIWNADFNANYIGKFNVTFNMNDTDNGFYQVNAKDDRKENDTPLNKVPRIFTIDGKISPTTEWTDDEKVYSEGTDLFYLFSDETYLYLYTKSAEVPDNFDIKIAAGQNAFNYVVQNGSLYNWTNNTYGTFITSGEVAKETGVEFKIALSALSIESAKDVKNIEVVNMRGWDLLNKFDVDLTGARKFVIDGKLTTDKEWNSSELVYNSGSDILYLYGDEENMYLYTKSAELPDNIDIRIAAGQADFNYVIQNGNLYTYINNSYGTLVTSTGFAKVDGVEAKVSLSNLGISTITDIKKIEIVNMKGWDISNTFLYNTETSMTLANYVTSIVYNSSYNQAYISSGGQGLYYHDENLANGAGDGSYRYSGTDPDNYVCFLGDDCTKEENLYRILGTDGNNIKLIKWTSFGNKVWDTSYDNTWENSTMDTYLNGTWLTSFDHGDLIEDYEWHVGGHNAYEVTPKVMYDAEIKSSPVVNRKVGLMYASDYGYAALPTHWSTELKSYAMSMSQNYLILKTTEWTISRRSDNSDFAFDVLSDGNVNRYSVVGPFAVRPSFYLKSSVKIVNATVDGVGSKTTPMIIS